MGNPSNPSSAKPVNWAPAKGEFARPLVKLEVNWRIWSKAWKSAAVKRRSSGLAAQTAATFPAPRVPSYLVHGKPFTEPLPLGCR
jgi:hypothetical protein